jgi:glycosyltransferase involved in cell wall biosynthesis
MKVVMLSNFYNSHQHSVAFELYRLMGDDYAFIQTTKMADEQKNLGYTAFENLCYIKNMRDSKSSKTECLALIENADILICGGYNAFAYKRIAQNRPIFIYSERLFVKSILPALNPKRLFTMIKRASAFNRQNNIYFLCSSAYLSYDLTRIGFKHKNMLKFGYFPHTDYKQKPATPSDKTKILWCGRMIDWKQGEHVLYMAKQLKDKGLNFNVTMIGDGNYRKSYASIIEKLNLSDVVNMLMPVSQKSVLSYMSDSDILVQTSNFKEGWGAVVNEAMAVGTCVVASSGVGSAPYLIENQVSGYIYKNGDITALSSIVQSLILYNERAITVGENAKKRIDTLWNGKVAANRLYEIFGQVLAYEKISEYADGPCSFAQIIKNADFE